MNKKGTRALASATVVGLVLSTAISTGNVQAAPGKVDRLGGGNRYQTAANVATKNWSKAENVILVSGEGYADALSASLLAQKLDAPVLLTGEDGLNEDTNKAINTLGAKNVYILGSEDVVSQNVQSSLEKSGKKVTRLAGRNRYQTNVAIANELVKNHGVKADDVLVVNGNKYLADALTAAPVAAKEGKILLLVGETEASAKEAKEFIKNNGVKNVTVIGRDVTVSDAMYKELGATKRVKGGNDRFETNRLVLQAFGLKGSHLYVANGQDDHLVDSLVASAIAGKYQSPVVLVSNNKEADAKAVEYIKANANEKTDLNVVGSEGILSNDLVGNINDAVKVEALKIDSVKAITDTKLSVKLSKAVDEAKAENFSIEGLTINSATLDASKTEVVLDVTGAKVNTEYTVKATGLKVNGKAMDDVTCKFTMPKAESLFTPEVTMKDTVLKADGQTSTLVTFALKDANGNIMDKADKVEVAFTTTFGTLAEKRVAVQNGIATVLLTSETLDSVKTANITATVVEAANKNLIGLEAKRNLLLDPNPEDKVDEKVGATLTEVQAAQADRVIVYFNKEVSVEKYAVKGTHKLDPNKAEAIVETNVGNKGEAGTPVVVDGILPVQGNSKALQLVLKAPLTDNSNVKVAFTDKTGTLPVPGTKYCKLTDARKPAMLSVAREGLKTLKVTFSEPVQQADANKASNWIIDGLALDNDAYLATAEVGKFDPATGEDTRNVVTINLGKDAKGQQRYFKSGTHSIQGANIGDWAEASDKGNNVMNTQTLDFDIPVDNTAPTAKVEVQSPEQYIVTFDKELNEEEAAIKNIIKLEKYNKDTAKWEAETKQTINIKEILNDKTKQYKVEVNRDWTEVYDTKVSKLNYYNDSYRLVVDKDAISSAANGVKNAKIELPLEGAMKTPDVTSPIIDKIVENTDATYKVTMSEPVKGFDGIDTLAQGETKVTPTAQFIKKDGSKTVSAKVEKGADTYDKELKVTPESALEAGEWTVVVRSISDDIGNTAASATKDFTVKAAEAAKEDKFAVVWSFADVNGDLDDQDTVVDDNDAADYVYVKFNKPVSITGDAKSALKTSNYQLNGMPLPTGTQIKANIKGLDDADKVTDSITIVLPNKYLNGKEQPHVLTISSYLESTTAGDVLTNGGAKKLTWTADLADVYAKEFAAEKALYALEGKVDVLAKAVAEDLKDAGKAATAKTALDNARTELGKAKTAMEATADVDGKGTSKAFIDYTAAKAGLTARYDAAKKALETAEAKVPMGVTLGATTVTTPGVKATPEVVAVNQVVELKITSKPSADGNISIAGEDVAVLAADADGAAVAAKIAAHAFTNWNVALKAAGSDTVVFTAKAGAADADIAPNVNATGVAFEAPVTTTHGVAHAAAVAGTAEVATTTVTAAANRAGKITVNVSDGTLNKDVVVELAATDNTADAVATKVRAALTADADVNGVYTVGGANAAITLTQRNNTGNVNLQVTLK